MVKSSFNDPFSKRFFIGSDRYKEMESRRYYYLERVFLKPLLLNSAAFQQYCDKLSEYKQPINGLKRVFSDFIKEHGLEHIKIVKTKKKDLSSNYCSESKKISINEFDLNNFKKDASFKNTSELAFIFLHELAHAYVLNYCNDFSYHDAFYFKIVIKMYSSISCVNTETFLHNKRGHLKHSQTSLYESLKIDRFFFHSNDILNIYHFNTLKEAKDKINADFSILDGYNKFVLSDQFFSCVMEHPLYGEDFMKGNDTVEAVRYLIYEYNNKFNLIVINVETFYHNQKLQEHNYLTGV